MSGSSIAAVNFLLYVTEALRRIVGANPKETSEDDVPALPPAPLVAGQEEVIDAPHVQWADEDEEEGGGDDAGIGAFGMDEEEEEDGDDPNAEAGEAVLVQPELRRYNTMIVDFYEVSRCDYIANFVYSPCSPTGRTQSYQRRRHCFCKRCEHRAKRTAFGE